MYLCQKKQENNVESKEMNNKKFYSKECDFRGILTGSSITYTKYKKYQAIVKIEYDNNKFVDCI